ncbi:unnamed protein product [Sympodiomycopsis kandeliae]
MACVNCRKRKIRCDSRQPVCSTCERLGKKCDYEPISEQENLIAREKKRVSRLRRNQLAAVMGSNRAASLGSSASTLATPASWPSLNASFGMGEASTSTLGDQQLQPGQDAGHTRVKGRRRNTTLPTQINGLASQGYGLQHSASMEHLTLKQQLAFASRTNAGAFAMSPAGSNDQPLANGDYQHWPSHPVSDATHNWSRAPSSGSFLSSVSNGREAAPLASGSHNVNSAQHGWSGMSTGTMNSLPPSATQEEQENRRRSSVGDPRGDALSTSGPHAGPWMEQGTQQNPNSLHPLVYGQNTQTPLQSLNSLTGHSALAVPSPLGTFTGPQSLSQETPSSFDYVSTEAVNDWISSSASSGASSSSSSWLIGENSSGLHLPAGSSTSGFGPGIQIFASPNAMNQDLISPSGAVQPQPSATSPSAMKGYAENQLRLSHGPLTDKAQGAGGPKLPEGSSYQASQLPAEAFRGLPYTGEGGQTHAESGQMSSATPLDLQVYSSLTHSSDLHPYSHGVGPDIHSQLLQGNLLSQGYSIADSGAPEMLNRESLTYRGIENDESPGFLTLSPQDTRRPPR